jgi:hypothetical protein
MAAGYFGYLGFSTFPQASVSFAKDLTKWAQAAVERARQDSTCQVTDLVNVANTARPLTTELDPLFDVRLTKYFCPHLFAFCLLDSFRLNWAKSK